MAMTSLKPLEEDAVLIVEDEPLVYLSIEDMLHTHGFAAVKNVSTIGDAHRWLANHRPRFAVLDVNLRGRLSWPIAQLLSERGIPFIISSAYLLTEEELTACGNPALLRKPYGDRELAAALSEIGALPE